MDDKLLIDSIATTVESLDSKVRALAAASQGRYKLGLNAGQSVREFGEYEAADDEGRDAIRVACRAAYEEIMSDIDRTIDAEKRVMGEPANANDVATVQLTLGRKHVTKDELQVLLDRYKGNYQLASAICDRARQDHIYLSGEPQKPRAFRSDADERALRVLYRYGAFGFNTGFMGSAQSFAENVVMALRHIDIFGNTY